MEYTAGTSWLQQQPIPDVHDTRPTTTDTWKETTTNVSAGAGPSGAQPGMDLSDFGLDLPASATAASISPPGPTYYPYAHGNYFLSGAPSSYTGTSYSTPQWPASSSSHIPLSSYSSLNGATNLSPASTQPPHLPSGSPQMMIDPALMSMNGSNSNPISHYSQQPFLSSQPQQRMLYSYPPQHTSHQSSLSINPSYVHTTPSHFQQQQPQQPQPQPQPHQQRTSTQQSSPPTVTLSPYILHSPPNPSLHAGSPIPASSFYANVPTQAQTPMPPSTQLAPSGPTKEQLAEKFLLGLRPLLKADTFTGAGAVSQLTNFVATYGPSEVDLSLRLEILSKIRDNAPNHYFRAWAENSNAMAITKQWLTESGNAALDSSESRATMPLLHIIDRLPMTVDILKESGIGKEIKRLSKSTSTLSAVRDMSSNIANKWRALISSSGVQAPSATRTNAEDTDAKSKKRKAEEAPPGAKGTPTAKKILKAASPSPALKAPPSKKPATKTTGAKDAKSDSSFFSAPKPKPKLPDFKKAPVSIKKEPDPNVAQPSSYDPFAEIVKTLKTRKDSPMAVATPPPAGQAAGPQAPTSKTGKKRSVRWAPDGQLELVKIIERAVYDDDPADGMHATHSLRDLDRSEGAALIAHLFEEQIDYFEPPLLEMPPTIEVPERGKDSIERVAQEERESTALGAAYMSDEHIPDSAAEPSSQIPEDQVDQDAKVMLTGPDVDAIFWSSDAPAAIEPHATASVAELVGQLSAPDVTMSSSGPGLPYNSYDPAMLAGFGPEQLSHILQQAQASLQNSSVYPSAEPIPPPPTQQQQQPQHPSADQNWHNTPYPPYDNEDARWNDDGWRGGAPRGRGRGRGRGFGRGDGFRHGRKPCMFHMQGRCRYGDQCDFSHETGLTY